MRTTFQIARWELLLLRRSGLVWLPLAVTFVLSIVSLWYGDTRYERDVAAVSEFRQSDEFRLGVYQKRAAAMELQATTGADGPIPKYEFAWGPRKPLWPTAWVPLSAVLPPHGLQRLNRGQTDLQRAAFAGWTRTATAETTDNPLSLLAGSFDLTFVLLNLFPLVAIALTWDLISGEEESGMTGSLLSHPISFRQLVLGKMLARLAILMGCWAIAMCIGYLAIASDSVDATTRFLAYAASGGLYAAIWMTICVTANVIIRRSGATAVTLAFLWLLLTFVGPAVLDRVSLTAYAAPSRIDYVNRKRELEKDSVQLDESFALRTFFERHPRLAPAEKYTGEGRRFLLAYARREEREKRAVQLEAEYEVPRQRRQTLAKWFTLFSPAIALRLAHNETTGAGDSRHEHYMQQVGNFHLESRGFFYPLIFSNAEFTSSDYNRIPRFRYTEQSWEDAFREAGPATGSLVLWLCSTILIVFGMTRRSNA